MSTIETSTPITPVAFVPPATTSSSPAVVPEMHRFSVDDYHRLMEVGILKEDDKVELLEGIICKMMTPIGSQHGVGVELTRKALDRRLPPTLSVWSQQAITTQASEPQPDVYVARGDYRKYTNRHPSPADLVIVVEIADTSLQFDRTEKLRIYAAAGIPEYWIVNLPERKLEVYRKPLAATAEKPAMYEIAEMYDSDSSYDMSVDAEQLGSISVRDILP